MSARALLGLLGSLAVLAAASLGACKQGPPSASVAVAVDVGKADPEVLARLLQRRLELLLGDTKLPFVKPTTAVKPAPARIWVSADLKLAACDQKVIDEAVAALVGAIERAHTLAIAPAVTPDDAVRAAVSRAVAPLAAKSLVAEALDVPGLDMTKAREMLAKLSLPAGLVMGAEMVVDPPGVRLWLVSSSAPISGRDIDKSKVETDAANHPSVQLQLTKAGGATLEKLTKGTQPILVVMVDGRVVSAPRVMDTISSGRAAITMGTGDFSQQMHDALVLSAAIEDGALAEQLRVVDRKSVCTPK